NVALICGVFGSIALLLSQFTQERGAAAGWTGGLLLIFIVLDMVHRVFPNTEWVSRLSPVYYYNLSNPLVPGYGTNAGPMLVLVDPGHRGTCRMDGRHRQTNRDESGRPFPGLTAPQGGDYQSRRE